jgi:iron(III) transport system substrate-binding protein
MKKLWTIAFLAAALGPFFFRPETSLAAEGKAPWQAEWEKVLEGARREGKVVVGIPAQPELRKLMEEAFARFKVGLELFPGRGPQNAQRIAAEHQAGVRNFDVFLGGSGTYEELAHAGVVDPFEPYLVLPEIKDPKYWWGGHIWEDNVRTHRYLYSFIADAGTGALWHNSSLAHAEELRSFDDLLNPKWKGKIGFLDPRTPGAGQSIWSFLWGIKGEDFVRKLVQQELFLGRDQRQIADALAKGKLAVSLGVTYYTFEPFLKAGLPVKELPTPKEGLPTSNGSGVIGVVKNPPHPNAAKVFVNWFLGREGQEIYGKALGQGTRRLDVDTKSLEGTRAAKDAMTVEEYHRLRNHLEDKYFSVRVPAAKFAEQILK